MSDEGKVTIFRYDPSVDKEPRYETYTVPKEVWYNHKIIDVISYIYEKFAPGLSFREPCRQQLCGACLMMVNKKSVLACGAIAEKDMVIEPHSKYPFIKDLVTNIPRGGE